VHSSHGCILGVPDDAIGVTSIPYGLDELTHFLRQTPSVELAGSEFLRSVEAVH